MYFSTREEVEDDIFHPKSHDEAKRWSRQSKIDLENAQWLLRTGPLFSAHACFQSHQVVEKCLKAMLYYYWGISGVLLKSHKVGELADQLRRGKPRMPDEVMKSVGKVANYYLPTRYPNWQPFDTIPANAFNEDQAEAAADAASKVLKYVEHCLK
jgi:HEPN domain-containing protein